MSLLWSISPRLPRSPRRLTLEPLEARLTFSVDGPLSFEEVSSAYTPLFTQPELPTVAAVAQVSNQAPTISRPVSGVTQVTSDRTVLSVLGSDDAGERGLKYRWELVGGPRDAKVQFSANNTNSAKRTTVKFFQVGDYQLRVTISDRLGAQTTANYRVSVLPTAKQLRIADQNNRLLSNGAGINVNSSQTSVSVVGIDQFKRPVAALQSVQWSYTAAGGATASLRQSGAAFTLSFDRSTDYRFQVSHNNLVASFTAKVSPSLSSIELSPGVNTVDSGSKLQFTARGLDQFGNPLARQPLFKWSTTAGSINSRGLWSTPATNAQAQVRVSSGSYSETANVRVEVPKSNFLNAPLERLVQTYFADGSITRPDMIRILRSAGVDGRVDTSELTDLRYLVSQAEKYKIPDHVRSLANEVVNGSPANARYQGAVAGNLTAGSSGALLNMLVDKWFMGTDRPTLTSGNLTYRVASGSLFGSGPSYLHQMQGQLGDCYIVSSLGVLASKAPEAIRQMIIDNRDGTFTVRFFTGIYGAFSGGDGSISDGFRSGAGTASYVTVDRWLPARADGRFAYSNFGASLTSSSNVLWIGLIEKAYAQWNETGKSGRNVVANTFQSIEGGWMSTFSAQVLGYNAKNYSLITTPQQKLIDALSSGKAVTIGTKSSGQSGSLVPAHAYSITGYNAQTNQFQLFNPWGTQHPAAMSYSQLQADCTYFVVVDPTATIPAVSGQVSYQVQRLYDGYYAPVSLSNISSWEVELNHFEFISINEDQTNAIHLPEANLTATPPAEETALTGSDTWRLISQQTSASERAVETVDLIFEWLADDEQLLA